MGRIIVNVWVQKLDFSMGENMKQDLIILKNAIAGCVDIRKTDEATDKTGIDYIATLRGGAIVNIDAKRREKGCSKYWDGQPEIALEKWSVVPDGNNKGKTGWTLNESASVDLILYTFDKTDCPASYLLPFQHLRLAFIEQYENWVERYGVKYQRNEGWKSCAVFVPIDKVLEAIRQASILMTA
jgi:hypothetical protein